MLKIIFTKLENNKIMYEKKALSIYIIIFKSKKRDNLKNRKYLQ